MPCSLSVSPSVTLFAAAAAAAAPWRRLRKFPLALTALGWDPTPRSALTGVIPAGLQPPGQLLDAPIGSGTAFHAPSAPKTIQPRAELIGCQWGIFTVARREVTATVTADVGSPWGNHSTESALLPLWLMVVAGGCAGTAPWPRSPSAVLGWPGWKWMIHKAPSNPTQPNPTQLNHSMAL